MKYPPLAPPGKPNELAPCESPPGSVDLLTKEVAPARPLDAKEAILLSQADIAKAVEASAHENR